MAVSNGTGMVKSFEIGQSNAAKFPISRNLEKFQGFFLEYYIFVYKNLERRSTTIIRKIEKYL